MITYTEMTPQQIYDTVCAHLAKQRHKAIEPYGGCVYRAENGDKCAAGCLIPDDAYDPKMEHHGIIGIVNKYATLPQFFKDHIDLISELQECHDGSDDDVRLRYLLKCTAGDYGLTPGAERAIKSWK